MFLEEDIFIKGLVVIIKTLFAQKSLNSIIVIKDCWSEIKKSIVAVMKDGALPFE